jgi:hypothetical protein
MLRKRSSLFCQSRPRMGMLRSGSRLASGVNGTGGKLTLTRGASALLNDGLAGTV